MNKYRVIFWRSQMAQGNYRPEYSKCDVMAPTVGDAKDIATTRSTLHSTMGHKFYPGVLVDVKPFIRLRDATDVRVQQ